jgi:hypothetical protein
MNHTHYLISNEDGNTFAVTPRTLVSNDNQLNFDVDALKRAIEDEYGDDISFIEYIVDKGMEEFTIHATLSNDAYFTIKLSPTWMY